MWLLPYEECRASTMAILECDSTQSAQTIAAILRKNRQAGIFVDGISGSTITVLAR